MEFYKVIADIDELKWFYDHVLYKPQIGESLMACLSCRNKRLSDKERLDLKISKAEMFHTEISKPHHDQPYHWENFLAFISKFETNKLAYVTKSDMPYPDHSIVLYLYLNPCSEAKCVQDTLQRISAINADMIGAAINHSKDGVADSIWKMGTIANHIKSCHAQNPSQKIWLDFDIDMEKYDDKAKDIIHSITEKFFGEKSFVMIKTSGGVHVMVRKEKLNFNPNSYLEELRTSLVSYNIKEVEKNDNCMCALPGTYQYGNPVFVLNKDDFSK